MRNLLKKNDHPSGKEKTITPCALAAYEFGRLKWAIKMKEGDDLTIGEIIQKQQPDVYKQLIRIIKFSKARKVTEEKVDFKRLMEDAPTYKRHHGSWRQVRNG